MTEIFIILISVIAGIVTWDIILTLKSIRADTKRLKELSKGIKE